MRIRRQHSPANQELRPRRVNVGYDEHMATSGERWDQPGLEVWLGSMTHNGGLEYNREHFLWEQRRRGGDEIIITTDSGQRFMLARGHLVDVDESARTGELVAKVVKKYDHTLTIGRPWNIELGEDNEATSVVASSLVVNYKSRTSEELPSDPTFLEVLRDLGATGIGIEDHMRTLYQARRLQDGAQ